MATARRRKTQSGQEIFEFGLALCLLMPTFLGAFIVGMNLIRSIQCNQMCRDLTDMYIHGADFSTYSMQQMAQRLAQGLNLQIGSSFSGNENSNNSASGNGLVTVTQIMYVGTTAQPNCQAAIALGDSRTHGQQWAHHVLPGAAHPGTPIVSTGVASQPREERVEPGLIRSSLIPWLICWSDCKEGSPPEF